jgi:hypothetical protein
MTTFEGGKQAVDAARWPPSWPTRAARSAPGSNDEASYYVPTSTLNWSARYMSHRF